MKFFTLAFLCLAFKLHAQNPGISIDPITSGFFRFTTWKTFDDNPPVSIPANGMYVVTGAGVILIDSPFDTTQLQALLDSIEARHHQKVVFCLATHSHNDRTAGLEYYSSLGIPTYTSAMTDSISVKRKEKRAQYHFVNDTTFNIGGISFEVYYPGKGHAPDNVTVYFPKSKVLYGGCFVKSTESKDLGNLADADVKEWKTSMEKLVRKYPDAKAVIPGHFGGMDKNSLKHTLQLLRTEEGTQSR